MKVSHEDNKKALETLGIDIPKGYRFVRYGKPRNNELFIDWDSKVRRQFREAVKGVGFIVEILREASTKRFNIEEQDHEEGKKMIRDNLFNRVQKRDFPVKFTTDTGLKLYGLNVCEEWTINRYDAFSDEYICTCLNGFTQKEVTHSKTEEEVFSILTEIR